MPTSRIRLLIGLLGGLLCLSRPCYVSAQPVGDGPQTFHEQRRKFFIPFDLPGVEPSELRKLQLYVSENGRTNWVPDATADPAKRGFNFETRSDGVYLFAVQVEYRDGERVPDQARDLVAMLRVVVDTAPPMIQLRSRRGEPGTGGVEWVVSDENIDPTTVRMEGRWPGQTEWRAVEGNFRDRGDHFFRFREGEKYQVRIVAKDKAGNDGVSEVVVTPPSGVDSQRPFTPEPERELPGAGGAGMPARTDTRIIDVKDRQITLRPKISVGRSGVKQLRLFVTRDQGQKWEEHDKIPVATITRQGEPVRSTDGRTLTETHKLDYTAPEDGLYGFCIVAVSSVGLSEPTPQRGDRPDIMVMVDTRMPRVRILKTDVTPAGESGNRVAIAWDIEDENLARNGIDLYYSEKPNAPDTEWKEIARGLDNIGRYDWIVGPDQPFRFYLRLRAIDRAGNMGAADSEQITVDLVKPKTIIVDIGQ